MSVVQKQFFFNQQKLKKMFSVMRLTFNAVELRFCHVSKRSAGHWNIKKQPGEFSGNTVAVKIMLISGN